MSQFSQLTNCVYISTLSFPIFLCYKIGKEKFIYSLELCGKKKEETVCWLQSVMITDPFAMS